MAIAAKKAANARPTCWRSPIRTAPGQRNTPAPAPKKTLGEWVQQWLDTYALDRCRPKTLERYRQLAA